MRIAFYAPLKGPDHPVPSGDRAMARAIIAALQIGGHRVEIVSTLRSFLSEPDPDRMRCVEAEAAAEREHLREQWAATADVPFDLWFTYHPFYKAPDFLGPCIAAEFAVPYLTAEASDAPKRATGAWAAWHRANQVGLRAAAAHVCFTDRDRDGVAALLGSVERLVDLPPFIATSPLSARHGPGAGPVALVCVAMMRPGDKMQSYAALATALEALPLHLAWHLSVVGDGPARDDVHRCFGRLPKHRLTWLGLLDATAVEARLAASDLFVWPGHNEAYGIAYLEAAACGLPSLAFDNGGISSVVLHGRTGLLVRNGDTAALAEGLTSLIEDAGLRQRLGAAARGLVLNERNLAAAASALNRVLERVSASAVPAA